MSESIIYHHQYDQKSGTIYLGTQLPDIPPVPESSQKPGRERASGLFMGISKILLWAGIAFFAIAYAPPALAWSSTFIQTNLSSYKPTPIEVKLSSVEQKKQPYTPALDPSLPKEARVVMTTIGVNTALQEAPLGNYEEALRKGVWRVTDFGSPDDRSRPTILAAHRFGYIFWSNDYRRENSFFNLPSLKIGDTVEIDYGQRKYLYEIYSEGTGTEIMDYSADLILYTCEYLTGDVRIFKYAKLITL